MVVGQSQRFLEQEEGGYRPCDPAITVERIQQLENAYAELVHLAVERRSGPRGVVLMGTFFLNKQTGRSIMRVAFEAIKS